MLAKPPREITLLNRTVFNRNWELLILGLTLLLFVATLSRLSNSSSLAAEQQITSTQRAQSSPELGH